MAFPGTRQQGQHENQCIQGPFPDHAKIGSLDVREVGDMVGSSLEKKNPVLHGA